ncbi:MAG: efflux RND transporter permease subunit [Saprospiraceae bacterium]
MNISEYAVKKYQFTLIVFVALFALGIYSLLNMPKNEDPTFEAPSFIVTIVYPGTSAADMEKLVVNPIEGKVNQFENLGRVFSTMADGVAIVIVEFKFGVNPAEKYQEVVREINGLRSELPPDLYALDIRKVTASDVNIYQYAIVSENASYENMSAQANLLKDDLKKIKQVKEIKLWAYSKQQVKINLDIAKLAYYKIPATRVIGAIQSENVNIPAGSININSKKFNVKTDGDYKSLDEVRNTVIGSSGSKIIYLKDVAEIGFNYEDETHIGRFNGHKAMFLSISQKDNQNIFDTNSEVEKCISAFREKLPKNILLEKVFDQGESVKTRLFRFAKDFGIAIALVLLTLLPLGFRASIVVMISIPLSLAMGLTMLNYLGYSLNQLSIVGMIISLGILVDDSIVVVENIERYLRNGFSKRKASIAATKQITLAVVGCTATLIVAFMPLIFLPEASGAFIRSLPMAVVTTILASMLISLTIVPFLSSRILSKHENPDGNIFLQLLKKGISGSYSKLLEKALQFPKSTLVIALAIFLESFWLSKGMGFSLFPLSEKPMFLVDINMSEGTNLQETNRITAEIEEIVKKTPEMKSFTTNVGKGNPQIYYNVLQHVEASNFAQIFVQLKPETHQKEKIRLINSLRQQLSKYPNAEILVKDFEQGPPVEAPLVYRIFGENLDTLRKLAFDVEKIVSETEGTIYTSNPLRTLPTDLRVVINKDKAGMLGIPTSDIDKTVRLGIAGINIGKYREEDGDEFNINISVPSEQATKGLEVLNKLYVNNLTGLSIPLRQVADIQMVTSTNQIKHFKFDRYASISAFAKTGFLTEAVNNSIEQKLQQYPFPKNYSYQAFGEKESKQRSFNGIGIIILITVFAFISILILEFGTFKSTLIVLSVIPLGIIGAVFMLWLWNLPFSFTAVIGFIALAGIEVKNSILLVDFTNQLREEGKGLDEAVLEAGEIRFVPIVLTTLTAIGGLIPLVVEFNPLYSPLALVLIGGLISSTLFSRLVTPVMYKLLPPEIN